MRAALIFIFAVTATPALADAPTNCPGSGDLVLSARTPQVDVYDAAQGKRVQSLDAAKFPTCTPITGRAANQMLQVNIGGKNVWVPPHMVYYHFAGNLPAVCRNLAMGSNQQKVGATRGLGEGCPKAGGK